MALNQTMLDPTRNPVPLPDEITVTTCDRGVELSLVVPGPTTKKYKALGSLWLTEQRVRPLHLHRSAFNSLFNHLLLKACIRLSARLRF